MSNKDKSVLISLPVNRVQLFKFTFKSQLSMLVKISLLLTVFAIPLFILGVVKGVVSSNIMFQMQQNPDNGELLKQYFSQHIFLDIFNIPCFVILSLGFAGAYTVIKQFVFQEGFTFFKSFFQGIKKNGKEFALVTLFFSIIYYLLLFLQNYLSLMNFELYIMVTIFTTLISVLIFDMVIFSYSQIPIYTNRFFQLIKNSFLFTFSRLWKISGILLITFFPLLIVSLFQSLIVAFIIYFIYIFIGFGYCVLFTTLYCHSVFDEMVNKTQFPSIYRKGLYNESDDEDE